MAAAVRCLPRLLMACLVWRHVVVVTSAGEMVKWYGVNVSRMTLDAQTPRALVTLSAITCATKASQDPQAHLFCLSNPDPDTTTCRLYPVQVGAEHDDSDNGPVQHCWTRHLSVCEADGTTYAEGDYHTDSTTCKPYHCHNSQLLPYAGSTVPPIPIADLDAKGCLLLETSSSGFTFDEARSRCRGLSGDLYVAGDFRGLMDYLGNTEHEQVWVGGRERAWLDGRAVMQEEWGPDDPNDGQTDCIRMRRIPPDAHYMMDTACSNKYPVLCQKGLDLP